MLNGNILKLENDKVPHLASKQLPAHADILFSSLSYDYVVTDAAAKACM